LLSKPTTKQFPSIQSDKEIFLNSIEAAPYLGRGWSGPEPSFRWTEGEIAELGFKYSGKGPISVALRLSPFVANEHAMQALRVNVNGKFVSEFRLGEQPLSVVRFIVPSFIVREPKGIKLNLPNNMKEGMCRNDIASKAQSQPTKAIQPHNR